MPFLMIIGGLLLFAILAWQYFTQKHLIGIDKALSDLRYALIKLGIIVLTLYFSMDVFDFRLKQFAVYNLFSAEDTRKVIEDLYRASQDDLFESREFYKTIGQILFIIVGYGGYSIYRFAKSIPKIRG